MKISSHCKFNAERQTPNAEFNARRQTPNSTPAAQMCVLSLLALFCAVASCLAQGLRTEEGEIARSKTDLLELARVANLPTRAQLAELPHIYKDIWTHRPAVIDAGGVGARLMAEDRKITTLPPDQFVAGIESRGRSALPNAVYDVGRKLLCPHAVELAPQIIDGLKSGVRGQRYAAVMLLEQAWGFQQTGQRDPPDALWGWPAKTPEQRAVVLKSPLQMFLPTLFEVWMQNLGDEYLALAALRFQSPRVRDYLISQVIIGKDRYQYTNFLSDLIANEDPPESLLKALHSPDAHIKCAAEESLYNSKAGQIKPYIKELVHDPDPKVRMGAAKMAFKFSPADWADVRSNVLSLKDDPQVEVAGQVVGLMAAREGKKLAPDVLRLLQNPAMPQLAHIYLYNAMKTISGTDFGYEEDFRGDRWMPTTPANTAALNKFAAWVKANGL